jgi:hypothetical protein
MHEARCTSDTNGCKTILAIKLKRTRQFNAQ